MENSRDEANAFYEAKIARFSKDRRSAINKDDTIRGFLLSKKADIASIIRTNMRKIKTFPKNQTLIKHLSAEEKVSALEQSLRNPQLKILAEFVKNKKHGPQTSSLSPLTRKRRIEQKRILNNASDDLNVSLEQDSALNNNRASSTLLGEGGRGVTLSNLGILLQDLEVIELEAMISEQEKKKRDEQNEERMSIDDNKKQLIIIQERPTLSELLHKTIEKSDAEAARQAELKLEQMRRFNEANLAGRIHNMLGIQDNEEQYLNGSAIRAEGNATDQNFKNQQADQNNDGYKYLGIEAILASASRDFNFNAEIDDSEEDEVSDEELRLTIKSRKAKEKARRDDLTTVKYAALSAIKSVEEVRKQINISSLVDKTIDLKALKAKQAILRERIAMSDDEEQQSISALRVDDKLAEMKIVDLGHSYSFSKLLQYGYAPCAEEYIEESSSSQDEFGPKNHKAHSSAKRGADLVSKMEKQMRKFHTIDDNQRVDTLDNEYLNKYNFKASFIGHISSVSHKKAEYRKRLKTYDHQKTTKNNVINQVFLEKKIYNQMHGRSSKSMLKENMTDGSLKAESILKEMQAINKGSMSSLAQLSMSASKMPKLDMREAASQQEENHWKRVSPGKSRDLTSQSAMQISKDGEKIAVPRQPIHIGQNGKPEMSDLNCDVSHEQRIVQKRTSDLCMVLGIVAPEAPFQRITNHIPSNMNVGNSGSSTENRFQQLTGYTPSVMDYLPPVNNQFSSLSLKIVLSPRQQVSNNARHNRQSNLMQSQSQRQEEHHIFKKAVIKDENQSNITLLKSQKELPKVDSNVVIPNRISQPSSKSKLQQSASDLLQTKELNQASSKMLNYERSGLVKTTSKSLINTQSSASHERLFQHKLGCNTASKKNGNVDLQKEKILPMPTASAKKSLLNKDNSREITARGKSATNSSNEPKNNKSLNQLQQERAYMDISELQIKNASNSKIGLHSSLLSNMKKAGSGSPQFLISPKMDDSMRDMETQLDSIRRGPSIQQRQQLQQTHFQIPLPDSQLDSASINQKVYEHQLAQNFRNKIQKRFGATTNVFSPSKGTISSSIRGSSRNDLNFLTYKVTTDDTGLIDHRFSIVSPTEVKAKRNTVISCDRPILAQEVSVYTGATQTNLRNNVILETRPLYHILGISDLTPIPADFSQQSTPQHQNQNRNVAGRSQQIYQFSDQVGESQQLECHPELNNVIKLELQERPRASIVSKSPPRKRTRKVTSGRDSLEAEIKPPQQPMYNDQGTNANMTQAMDESIQDESLRDQGTDSMTPSITARIQIGKKLSAGVVTQTMQQSNMNLTDQSQCNLLQMSNSPLEFAHKGQQKSNKNMKGSKVPSTFHRTGKIDEPSLVPKDIRNLNNISMEKCYKNGGAGSDEHHTSKSGSNLRIDASMTQNSPEASPQQSRNRLSPHLSGTNVRIALQKEKEKSKRVLKFMHQTGSKQSLESAKLNKNPSGLHNKGSSPFLTSKQITGLDTDLQVQSLAGQELRTTKAINLSSKEKLSDLGKNLVTSSEQAVQVDDPRDANCQIIKRNSSQLENPLLQCDEEDDMIDVSSQHQYSHGNLHKQMTMSNEEKRRQELQSGTDNEGIDHNFLTAKGWTPQHPSQTREMLKMMNRRESAFGKISNLSDGEQELTLSGCGASQVRIEQDIKEMQSLLPPLLESTSTKQFFKEDEIKMDGEDRKRAEKRIKDGSVPLMYVRDSSKMSVERNDDEPSIKLKGKALQKYKKDAQLKRPRLNHSLHLEAHLNPLEDQRQTYYLGVQHQLATTPVQENQRSDVGGSSLMNLNMMPQSTRGSSTALRLSHEPNQATAAPTSIYHGYQNINSRTLGPYLKTFTQRIKLPNLNRSVYNTQHSTGTCTRSFAPSPLNQPQQQQTSTKHLIFNERGQQEIVGQRMANNFQVKIKKTLNQSIDARQQMRTLVLDGTPPFFDLGLDGQKIGAKKTSKIKFEKQSEEYDKDFHVTRNIRGKDGRIYMHQTLTQKLMSPQDLKPSMRRSMPHKPTTLRAGSQTSRYTSKPNEDAQAEPGVTTERHSSVKSELEKAEQRESQQKQMIVQQSVRRLPKKATSGIVSGSMELSSARKRNLANQISSKLVPLRLPPVGQLKNNTNLSQDLSVLQQGYPKQLQDYSVAQHIVDASNAVRVGVGSITTDQVRDLMKNPRSGSVMISRSSIQKVDEGVIPDAVKEESDKQQNQTNRHNSASVSNGKTSRIINQVPQTSQETLLINKAGTISPCPVATWKQDEVSLLQNTIHEGEMSPDLTTAQWSINPKTRMREEDVQLDSQKDEKFSAPQQSSNESQQTSNYQELVQTKSVDVQKNSTMTISSEVNVDIEPPTKEELLFWEHSLTMARLREKEEEQAQSDNQLSKQPISFSGQNDISNSIWVDQANYSRKRRPKLLMRDMQDKTRNGKVEMGQSPFNPSDFIRMDGKTARLTGREITQLPDVKSKKYLCESMMSLNKAFDIKGRHLLESFNIEQ